MTEPTLFVLPPADGNLSDQQQIVHDLLRDQPGGLRALDVGVALHQALSKPCACRDGHGCKWSSAQALQILRVLKGRDLVRQRKGGVWQHHAAPVQTAGRPDSRPTRTYDPATADIPF